MNTTICNNCGKSIPDDSQFCHFCGEKVDTRKPLDTCSKCNQVIPQDSEFCPFCGEKIQLNHTPSFEKNPYLNDVDSNGNKTHYDFTNINENLKQSSAKKAKNVKVPDDEKTVLVGNIVSKPPSFIFWISSIANSLFLSMLLYFTRSKTVVKPSSTTSSIRSTLKLEKSYVLGFLNYKTNDHYNIEVIFLILIIFLLAIFIPFLIYKIMCTVILQNELILTNKKIYFYSGNDCTVHKISIDKIKCIDCTKSPWFLNSDRVKITLHSGKTFYVSGLSNAQDFIQATIQVAQESTVSEGEQ